MRQRRSREVAGFTLIELLVSLTGGLFVSIAVFALARDATRFYQREGRLANATLAGLVGFERLRADVARAAFLSSPNVQSDPLVCLRPAAGTLLADLASVRIINGGSPANTTLAANGLAPDRLVLSGSYSGADDFPVRTVDPPSSGGSVVVYLQTTSGPMARLGFTTATTEDARTRILSSVFAVGRGLRIVDNEGRQHFGVIASVAGGPPGGNATITLSAQSPIEFRADSSLRCGLKGIETGASANVVNFISYEIRSLRDNSSYAALYETSANDPFDADRTELVRTELDLNDGTTLELVETVGGADQTTVLEELATEYAVDLQLEVTAVTNVSPLDPEVELLDATSFANYVGAASGGSTPQRIRSVRTRLNVRSREADRESAVNLPGLYRIGLGANGGRPFARVRTFQADVMLNNATKVRW